VLGVDAIRERGENRHGGNVAGKVNAADPAGLRVADPPSGLKQRDQGQEGRERRHAEHLHEAHGEYQQRRATHQRQAGSGGDGAAAALFPACGGIYVLFARKFMKFGFDGAGNLLHRINMWDTETGRGVDCGRKSIP